MMEFTATSLQGLYLVSPFISRDDRGSLVKSFERNAFRTMGIDMRIQEAFESSSKKAVLRGLHFQFETPQAKLISCPSGCIFDVAVDLRQDSETFGRWEGFYLEDRERQSLYIPGGFAHGFLTLSETARVSYQCHGAYRPEADTGILWNDPDIGIEWPLPLTGAVRLSPRDRSLPGLREHISGKTLPREVHV